MTTRQAGVVQSSSETPLAADWWRRSALAAFVGCAIAVAAAPAIEAATCPLDLRPGATLFLPYFDVDLSNSQGRTTLFSVANASDAAILTRVTLWSDLAIPTLSFPIYLTGYDVETVNLRDVFEGRLPRTASAGQDPTDTLSPGGIASDDVNFASCNSLLPPTPPNAAEIDDLRREHLGLPSNRRSGMCTARPHGDRRVRGFVTIDTVNNCTSRNPTDPQYFLVDTTAQDVLWGDFIYLDPGSNFAQAEALVRLQTGTFAVGDQTFYGWLHGTSAIDRREPLPTTWMARFLDGGLFTGGTDVILWHAPDGPRQPFACNGSQPPVQTDQFILFNETEDAEQLDCPPGSPPLPCSFPFDFTVTGRTTINGLDGVPTSFQFGALYTGGATVRQSWMGTVSSASGRFGVGLAATPLDTGCAPRSNLP